MWPASTRPGAARWPGRWSAAAAVIDRTVAKSKLLKLIDDSKKLAGRGSRSGLRGDGGVRQRAVCRGRSQRRGDSTVSTSCRRPSWRCAAALQALIVLPDIVLIDGNQIPPRLGCKAETIVGGDAASYSIAAASIFAKVTRDRTWQDLLRLSRPTAGRPTAATAPRNIS